MLERRHPTIFHQVFWSWQRKWHHRNSCRWVQLLKRWNISRQWKRARLVLISKAKGEPGTPFAYRQLWMLNSLEQQIRNSYERLHAMMEVVGNLSERQYGFSRGRSTIGAIREIIRAVQRADLACSQTKYHTCNHWQFGERGRNSKGSTRGV